MTGYSYRKIKKELLNEEKVKGCARRFGIVGDKTRVRICFLLCHHPKLSVGEISKILDAPVSRISHSLQKLREIHLVEKQKKAQKAEYFISDSEFSHFLKSYFKVI